MAIFTHLDLFLTISIASCFLPSLNANKAPRTAFLGINSDPKHSAITTVHNMPTTTITTTTTTTSSKATHIPSPSIYSIPTRSVRSLSSLSATNCKSGSVTVSREKETGTMKEYELQYQVHQPMRLSSQQAAPLLVLHGGPGVPSDYLYPLCDVIPYRSLIFFDQLGCGRSQVDDDDDCGGEKDPNPNVFSIELTLDDIELLIQKLGLRQFHLYGQSYGGILAYEYLKRISEGRSLYKNGGSKCLSVVLSSTPTNVRQVEQVAGDLIASLNDDNNEDSSLAERFRMEHQCRTSEMPQPLMDAYDSAGTVWRGTDVISDWKAVGPADDAIRMPSAMVMRGEHDFVTEECVAEWKSMFNHKFVRYKVLKGCSHHGLLENGDVYGDLVDSFLSEYD